MMLEIEPQLINLADWRYDSFMQIEIHALSLEEIKGHEEKIIASIPSDRLEKANRYIKESDRLLSLGGSYLIEKYAGPGPLLYGEYGKPYKEGRHFSLSHSGDYVIFASSPVSIGVDVELIKERKRDISKLVFEEGEEPKDDEEFYLRWCVKESVAKCLGNGIFGGIKHIPNQVGSFAYEGKDLVTSSIKWKRYRMAVALNCRDDVRISVMEERIA